MTDCFRAVLALWLLSFLVSCATTQPTRFYRLSPDPGVAVKPDHASARVVGVGPIDVAAYLDRSQIVTRVEGYRLDLAEFDRWAEPIGDNIASVLAVDLSRQVPRALPIVRPWSEAAVDLQVVVKIRRFDWGADGEIVLLADWGIVNRDRRELVTVRESRIVHQVPGPQAPESGPDYNAIVQGMSDALSQLSREVSTELARVLRSNDG